MYMLTNGIQQTEDFNDFKSNHFTAIVKPTGKVAWTTSYYFGQEQADGGAPAGPDGFFKVFDTYVSYAATPTFSARPRRELRDEQVNKGDETLSLQGIGAYARYQAIGAGRVLDSLRAARRRGAVRRHRAGAAGSDR